MAAYFIMGIATVMWALLLAALGLTRPNFPPSGTGLRVIIGITALLVLGTIGALMATTHKEHPRIEAAEAAEEAAEGEKEVERTGKDETQSKQQKQIEKQQSAVIKAAESNFKIALEPGTTAKAGMITFDVANTSDTGHDLAVEGSGVEEKTDLIDAGAGAKLDVDLKPGKYKIYCTVPGHEQAGMKVDLTVQ